MAYIAWWAAREEIGDLMIADPALQNPRNAARELWSIKTNTDLGDAGIALFVLHRSLDSLLAFG